MGHARNARTTLVCPHRLDKVSERTDCLCIETCRSRNWPPFSSQAWWLPASNVKPWWVFLENAGNPPLSTMCLISQFQAFSVLLLLPFLLFFSCFFFFFSSFFSFFFFCHGWQVNHQGSLQGWTGQHHFCSMCCKPEVTENLHVLLLHQYFPRACSPTERVWKTFVCWVGIWGPLQKCLLIMFIFLFISDNGAKCSCSSRMEALTCF